MQEHTCYMLFFIGLGIWDEKDLSIKALETLKGCNIVFAETYTSELRPNVFKRLEKIIQKKITILGREQVEDGKIILAKAKNKKVALITPGDPFIASTHISLKLDAEKQKIKTKILHAQSIYTSAISESGLQLYKFGRPCSLSFWSEHYKPTSTLEVILENMRSGLHTIVFLDIKERCMEPKEALELLLEIQKAKNTKEIDNVLVISRLGSDEQTIRYGNIKTLLINDLGKPPSLLIIPGKLHFMEEEALRQFQ
ncbi:diphthine synthase [Candidatus Micrarchaeota archaeon]|nr:diphthine synthase [Candidatus Micrarchaeota archaeon]